MDKFDQDTMSMAMNAKVLDYCRFLSAEDEARRDVTKGGAVTIFTRRWPGSISRSLVERSLHSKALVPGATSTGWGNALMPDELARAFAAYVHPFTLIGRVRDARRVPLNTRIIRSTVAMTLAWVGAGKPAPVTAGQLSGSTLRPARASGIVVTTEDTLRLAAPGSAELLRDELRNGITAFLDIAFVDPTAAAVADVSPASITWGVVPMSPTGTTFEAAVSDIARLLGAYANAGGKLEHVVLLMPSRVSISLGMSGVGQFRDLGRNGGQVAGIPVIASEALSVSGSPGGGNMVVALDASKLFIADDLGIEISTSQQGTLELLDNPTNDSGTPTATTQVSLWQTNAVGVMVDRYINWDMAAGGVAIMDDVNWGSIGSPS